MKDVIWLEVQAFHAERTPMEEDCYLCTERENVEPLLNDIKNYRFQRQSRRWVLSFSIYDYIEIVYCITGLELVFFSQI